MDYKKRVVDLEIGWPDSIGDGRIWSCSTLKKVHKDWLSQLPTASLPTHMLSNGQEVYEDIPPFILTDSAYSNTRNMMTTYKTTEILSDSIVRELNRKLGGARYHVEHAFEILKERFQIFKKPLKCSHEDVRLAIILTSSIFIIHNFLIEVNDDYDISLEPIIDTEHMRDENDNDDQEEDMSTRAVLLRYIKYIEEY